MHRTHAAAVKLLTHALVLPASGVVPQAERSNRNRNQHSNCNQRGVQQCQPVRKDRQLPDHLLGLQSCVPLPPHQQVLAAAAVSDFLMSASEFPFNIVSTSPRAWHRTQDLSSAFLTAVGYDIDVATRNKDVDFYERFASGALRRMGLKPRLGFL
jgi:hypothetical protein